MAGFLLAVGRVTSLQYAHARKELWLQGTKPKLYRITAEEWALKSALPAEVALNYEEAPSELKPLLLDSWISIAKGSVLHVPFRLCLESGPHLEVRIIQKALSHYLRSPVGAIMVEEPLWLSPESELWQEAFPNAQWYAAHPDGWVEVL